MRLRIETLPPLVQVKSWISVNTSFFSLRTCTIEDLRKQIISKFDLPNNIQLRLDDFNLPENEAIGDLLKEGKLVKYVSSGCA